MENTHLAFCFDEAVEFILSYRYFEEKKENNMIYKVMKWTQKPNWNDEEVNKPVNNLELIKEMQENLKKIK